jgi:thiamine transporter ThiT
MNKPELNRQLADELNRQKVRPAPNSGPIWFGVGGLIAGVLGVVLPYVWFVRPDLTILEYALILLAIVLSAIGLRRGMSGRAMAGAGLALGTLLGADLALRLIIAAGLRNVPF